MLEFLVGSGLATAAGLNAWMPLFVLGLSDRLLSGVELPATWSWLSGDVALWIIGALLVVEIVADKIPVLDSINDAVQTVIRPAAGGIVFGAGSGAQTLRVDDPAAFFADQNWVPVVVGIVIALGVHVLKAVARPVANTATGGVAAPVLSTAEDAASLGLAVLAIVLPVLGALCAVAVLVGIIVFLRRRRRRAAPSPS